MPREESYFFFAFLADFFAFFAAFLACFFAAMGFFPFSALLAGLFFCFRRFVTAAGLAFCVGRALFERPAFAGFAGPPTPLPTGRGTASRCAALDAKTLLIFSSSDWKSNGFRRARQRRT